MPINIEDIIERAFEQAFSKALDQTLQTKAETLFKKAFENGSPLSKKLEEKMAEAIKMHLDMMRRSGEDIPVPPRIVDLDVDDLEEGELCTWIDVGGRPARKRRAAHESNGAIC